MTDIIGTALLDYYHGKYTEDIMTETNITEEDVMPLPYLFRGYANMPEVEQKALDLAFGSVLDVGCGAGSHSLYLQEKGLQVTAIDTSKGAVKVCKLRGIHQAEHIDLLHLENKKFNTILLLMNGTGIFQKLENVSIYLQQLKSLLTENGQILIDSSDLKYMWDAADDKGIPFLENQYYGELEFIMRYKGEKSATFNWVYIDEATFKACCEANGLQFQVVKRGDNYEYLARLQLGG